MEITESILIKWNNIYYDVILGKGECKFFFTCCYDTIWNSIF